MCAAGVLSNFNGIGLSIQRMVLALAENTYNSKLWMGHEADDVTLSFTNIVFMAMARPQCSSCYSNGSSCNNMKGLLIPVVQILGNDNPHESGLKILLQKTAPKIPISNLRNPLNNSFSGEEVVGTSTVQATRIGL